MNQHPRALRPLQACPQAIPFSSHGDEWVGTRQNVCKAGLKPRSQSPLRCGTFLGICRNQE